MKRTFTEEQLDLAAWGDLDGFSTVRKEITDQGRWNTSYELIFKEDATGKLYRAHYSKGSTEQQDDGPQFYETDIPEVEAYEKTITDYREV